ncbi:MAG: TetR family transcriptional regulator [Acidimicrobiia bacterium]|nr:TetR family transcriptional regulator [Acidimicrobiia bacterium]
MEATPALSESQMETRRRLIETAIRIFAERGFERARLADIAREAGFTTGAIYSNFPNKAHLLAESIAAYAPDEIKALFGPVLDVPLTKEVLRERIGILLSAPSVPEAESLIMEGLAVAARDPSAAEMLRGGVAERLAASEDLFDAASATSMVHGDLTEDVLRYMVLVFVFGAMALKALGWEPPSRAEIDALVDHLADAFVPRDG